uniref:Formiminotransferase cyclodeaminase N-terminal like 1 n=1 Tax=Lates calcarifer TaxID=8187 RepID=A0A4W6DUZ5_LATCA
MASSSIGRRMVACLLNISEARRKDLVETVAKAALYNTEGKCIFLLNIFNDHDYNRSVITIRKKSFNKLSVAQGLTERVQGTSAFLFGWADTPLQRGLAQRRKEVGWFKKTTDLQEIRPDLGTQPQKRFGLTGRKNSNFYPRHADSLSMYFYCSFGGV